MRRLFKITLGAMAGAVVAFFFGTNRGRKLRNRAERQVLPHLKESGGWILDEFAGVEETAGETDEALQGKIEEVRQKLKEQQALEDAED